MQKIKVENFQAIKDIEIELDKTLLLIGEQASGKSTISKFIYFFKSLRQDFVDMVFDNLEDDQHSLETTFRQRAFKKFYNYFGSTRHLPSDFEAQYYYDYAQNKSITLSLYPDKGLKIYVGPRNFYQELFFNERLTTLVKAVKQYTNLQNLFERREFQLANRQLETYINQLFNDSRIPLFIPAGRNITVNYPEQFKLYSNLQSDLVQQQGQESQSVDLHLMLRFLEHVERIRQRFQSHTFETLIADKIILDNSVDQNKFTLIQNHIHKILKGHYGNDQYGELLYLDPSLEDQDSPKVYFKNASSGQQEAIRILQDIFLNLLDGNDVFRVIEEPEAHLYPMAQKHLIELIAILLNESNSQVIMTTHSPYILSIVNNLLFAARVVKQNEKAIDEVSDILPQICWLDPATTNVYFLKNGYCRSVFDEETGLIDQNSLDEISEELGADFEELYDIYARVSHG